MANLQQAMEVFRPALNYVENQPAYKRVGVTALKKSIFSRSGARFQPVISKGKHGARPYIAVLDELHQAVTPDFYDTFKTGCNKTPNSLLVTIYSDCWRCLIGKSLPSVAGESAEGPRRFDAGRANLCRPLLCG